MNLYSVWLTLLWHTHNLCPFPPQPSSSSILCSYDSQLLVLLSSGQNVQSSICLLFDHVSIWQKQKGRWATFKRSRAWTAKDETMEGHGCSFIIACSLGGQIQIPQTSPFLSHRAVTELFSTRPHLLQVLAPTTHWQPSFHPINV